MSRLATATASLVTLWSDYRLLAAERKAILQLSGMSDATLRDIGLTRAGIPEAVRHNRSRR